MNRKNREKLYELRKKNPFIAILLSTLVTGTGQMYANRWGRGFLFLGLQIILWVFLLGWIMWIVATIDAYYSVKNYNEILKLELEI